MTLQHFIHTLPRMLSAFLLLSTAACQTTQQDPIMLRVNQGTDLTALTAGAGTRAILVRTDTGRPYICDDPGPDAALNEFADSGFSISLIKVGDTGDGQNSNSIGEAGLGGRSPNVLITRELLYRFCEFAGNTTLTDDQRIALYQATLNAVVSINQTNLGDGSADMSSSDIDASSSTVDTDTDNAGSATGGDQSIAVATDGSGS
jgi:hypothetical protein